MKTIVISVCLYRNNAFEIYQNKKSHYFGDFKLFDVSNLRIISLYFFVHFKGKLSASGDRFSINCNRVYLKSFIAFTVFHHCSYLLVEMQMVLLYYSIFISFSKLFLLYSYCEIHSGNCLHSR